MQGDVWRFYNRFFYSENWRRKACHLVIPDSAYAAKVASNGRMREILKDSCGSYVANDGKNTIGVSKDFKDKKVELTCRE
jgi:hypothetical protein